MAVSKPSGMAQPVSAQPKSFPCLPAWRIGDAGGKVIEAYCDAIHLCTGGIVDVVSRCKAFGAHPTQRIPDTEKVGRPCRPQMIEQCMYRFVSCKDDGGSMTFSCFRLLGYF